jgi:hypothetical protein
MMMIMIIMIMIIMTSIIIIILHSYVKLLDFNSKTLKSKT